MQGNAKRSLFSPEVLKRVLIYGLLTLFLGSAQCAFFPFLDFCPRTPDLILAMLVAIAMLDSESSAAICAVACGFFIDAIGTSGVAISPLIYFATVIVISFFTEKVLKSFPSFLLLLIPALVCRAISTFICAVIADRAFPSFWIIGKVILPEMLCTAIFAMPIYFLLRLCVKPLQKHGRFMF